MGCPLCLSLSPIPSGDIELPNSAPLARPFIEQSKPSNVGRKAEAVPNVDKLLSASLRVPSATSCFFSLCRAPVTAMLRLSPLPCPPLRFVALTPLCCAALHFASLHGASLSATLGFSSRLSAALRCCVNHRHHRPMLGTRRSAVLHTVLDSGGYVRTTPFPCP